MGRKESYEAKTEQLIQPLIDANNFELVDVEFVKEGSEWYLRVYIDKEGGITVDDCEIISRAFNEILDKEDYISEQYIFEVSSPGLMRPLKKEKDYIRSVGKLIDVKTYSPIEKRKEFTGILKAFDEKSVTVDCDGAEVIFEKSNIAMIRLAFCD
ncbi:MAG: ribosome maturation factor RimP [Lachnospira sp.]|nr:ribosome maturation factor RimP [Lachnospira sp.]